MMTPRHLAAAAVLAGGLPLAALAPSAAAQATPSPAARATPPRSAKVAETTAPVPKNDGMYALFPATPEAEKMATGFYASYGDAVPIEEVRRGTFRDRRVLAAAPPPDRNASARAGVGVAKGAAKIGLLAALTALIAALALGLMATVGTSPAKAAVPVDFKGVVAEDVYVGSDTYQAAQFKKIQGVGFTVVRQVFRWNEIEPLRSNFDFSATDRFVLAAAKARIRVQPLLFGEPTWATSRPLGNTVRTTFPPAKNSDFADFARAIALRYGPDGTFWPSHREVIARPFTAYQLWNEPNLPNYWGNKPNAKAYAALLKATTPSIKAVDPKAVIVSGGIPDSKLGIRARPYLSTFLKAGGGKTIDAVGIHPYSATVASVLALTKQMRRTLDGVGGKRIGLVVTEIGWAVGGPKTTGRTVTAKAQSTLVPAVYKAFARARASLKLKSVVYFAWRDSPTYPGRSDFWGLRTGLFKQAGTAKPVVKTLTKSFKTL